MTWQCWNENGGNNHYYQHVICKNLTSGEVRGGDSWVSDVGGGGREPGFGPQVVLGPPGPPSVLYTLFGIASAWREIMSLVAACLSASLSSAVCLLKYWIEIYLFVSLNNSKIPLYKCDGRQSFSPRFSLGLLQSKLLSTSYISVAMIRCTLSVRGLERNELSSASRNGGSCLYSSNNNNNSNAVVTYVI